MVTLTVDDPAAVSGTARRRPPAPRITGTTPWWSSAPTALALGTIRWVPR